MSERQAVMAYLQDRYTTAFSHGDDDEASSCHRFYSALEAMTDAEYETEFCDESVDLGAIS